MATTESFFLTALHQAGQFVCGRLDLAVEPLPLDKVPDCVLLVLEEVRIQRQVIAGPPWHPGQRHDLAGDPDCFGPRQSGSRQPRAAVEKLDGVRKLAVPGQADEYELGLLRTPEGGVGFLDMPLGELAADKHRHELAGGDLGSEHVQSSRRDAGVPRRSSRRLRPSSCAEAWPPRSRTARRRWRGTGTPSLLAPSLARHEDRSERCNPPWTAAAGMRRSSSPATLSSKHGAPCVSSSANQPSVRCPSLTPSSSTAASALPFRPPLVGAQSPAPTPARSGSRCGAPPSSTTGLSGMRLTMLHIRYRIERRQNRQLTTGRGRQGCLPFWRAEGRSREDSTGIPRQPQVYET